MSTLAGVRIAIVTPRLEPVGGTEIYVARLIELQRELGATVHAFTGNDVELGESIHPLHRPNAQAVAQSAERIAACCDFVEFHGCAPLPLLRALSGRVPIVLYLHTSELTCPAGGRYLPASGQTCFQPPGIACNATDSVQHCLSLADGERFPWLQRVKAGLRGALSNESLQLAEQVVFNSRALQDLFRSTLGFEGRSHVLPPLLPDHRVATPARRPGRLLFCGRLAAFKGVQDAIAVCAAIAKSELVVAGTGPAEASARELASRLECSHRVHFRGWLGHEGVAREMAQASVLLVPSRGFEAWGMAGPEAVSLGCAVAAWDVGGIREWCQRPWGELASAGNVDALTEAAARLLDAQVPEETRAKWQEEVRRRWGRDAYATKYAELVSTIPVRRG